jgi:hypothetical protein
MRRSILFMLACASILTAARTSAADCAQQASPTPYPTTVLADYVLGCMLSNGTSPNLLRKCACSIDFIAESIPYEEYERVETLLRLQQMPAANRNAVYKGSNWANNAVAHLREVQAESTLRCF